MKNWFKNLQWNWIFGIIGFAFLLTIYYQYLNLNKEFYAFAQEIIIPLTYGIGFVFVAFKQNKMINEQNEYLKFFYKFHRNRIDKLEPFLQDLLTEYEKTITN